MMIFFIDIYLINFRPFPEYLDVFGVLVVEDAFPAFIAFDPTLTRFIRDNKYASISSIPQHNA